MLLAEFFVIGYKLLPLVSGFSKRCKNVDNTNYSWYYGLKNRAKLECFVPISGKNLAKLFINAGYRLVQGGKGSHMKLKKKGCPTIIIPDHKELSKGLEHALMKMLKDVIQ